MPLLWQPRSPSALFAASCCWLMAPSSPGSLCHLQHCVLDTAPDCIDPWALPMPDTGLCTCFLLNFIRFLQAVHPAVNGHSFLLHTNCSSQLIIIKFAERVLSLPGYQSEIKGIGSGIDPRVKQPYCLITTLQANFPAAL